MSCIYIEDSFDFPDYCKGSIWEKVSQIKGEIFRSLDGRTTLRFESHGRSFFLKRHTGIGWGEIAKNLLALRLPVISARNEWQAIDHLKRINIDTMHAVAYGELGRNPAKIFSFIITEDLINTTSLEDYCAIWNQSRPSFNEKKLLLDKVARSAKLMHQSGMNHRDFYICHFLLPNSSDISLSDKALHLIDLHRAQLRSIVPNRWLIKDIAGLFYSTFTIGLTKTDFYRFIRLYTEQSLRQELTDNIMFWNKVYSKAVALYQKDFGTPPPRTIRKLS